MKLSATHAFNCIDLMVKFGQTSCEDIPPALYNECLAACDHSHMYVATQEYIQNNVMSGVHQL